MECLLPDCSDYGGNSPLHLAAQHGFTQTIKLLMNVHPSLLNAENNDGVSRCYLPLLGIIPFSALSVRGQYQLLFIYYYVITPNMLTVYVNNAKNREVNVLQAKARLTSEI